MRQLSRRWHINSAKPKVVAIIQARMGASRLPGKVLMDVGGRSMLRLVVERTRKAELVDEVVIATTTELEDDAVAEAASGLGVASFRGSIDNVLERYLGAATKFDATVVVRITADCPLMEPTIIDQVIRRHLNSKADYTANILKRTFPRGWDVEVFNLGALAKVSNLTTENYEREHVTIYFHEHQDEFTVINVEAKDELRRPDLRLCVDEPSDIKLVRQIFQELDVNNFSAQDVVDLFERQPELEKINASVQQKVR